MSISLGKMDGNAFRSLVYIFLTRLDQCLCYSLLSTERVLSILKILHPAELFNKTCLHATSEAMA